MKFQCLIDTFNSYFTDSIVLYEFVFEKILDTFPIFFFRKWEAHGINLISGCSSKFVNGSSFELLFQIEWANRKRIMNFHSPKVFEFWFFFEGFRDSWEEWSRCWNSKQWTTYPTLYASIWIPLYASILNSQPFSFS